MAEDICKECLNLLRNHGAMPTSWEDVPSLLANLQISEDERPLWEDCKIQFDAQTCGALEKYTRKRKPPTEQESLLEIQEKKLRRAQEEERRIEEEERRLADEAAIAAAEQERERNIAQRAFEFNTSFLPSELLFLDDPLLVEAVAAAYNTNIREGIDMPPVLYTYPIISEEGVEFYDVRQLDDTAYEDLPGGGDVKRAIQKRIARISPYRGTIEVINPAVQVPVASLVISIGNVSARLNSDYMESIYSLNAEMSDSPVAKLQSSAQVIYIPYNLYHRWFAAPSLYAEDITLGNIVKRTRQTLSAKPTTALRKVLYQQGPRDLCGEEIYQPIDRLHTARPLNGDEVYLLQYRGDEGFYGIAARVQDGVYYDLCGLEVPSDYLGEPYLLQNFFAVELQNVGSDSGLSRTYAAVSDKDFSEDQTVQLPYYLQQRLLSSSLWMKPVILPLAASLELEPVSSRAPINPYVFLEAILMLHHVLVQDQLITIPSSWLGELDEYYVIYRIHRLYGWVNSSAGDYFVIDRVSMAAATATLAPPIIVAGLQKPWRVALDQYAYPLTPDAQDVVDVKRYSDLKPDLHDFQQFTEIGLQLNPLLNRDIYVQFFSDRQKAGVWHTLLLSESATPVELKAWQNLLTSAEPVQADLLPGTAAGIYVTQGQIRYDAVYNVWVLKPPGVGAARVIPRLQVVLWLNDGRYLAQNNGVLVDIRVPSQFAITIPSGTQMPMLFPKEQEALQAAEEEKKLLEQFAEESKQPTTTPPVTSPSLFPGEGKILGRAERPLHPEGFERQPEPRERITKPLSSEEDLSRCILVAWLLLVTEQQLPNVALSISPHVTEQQLLSLLTTADVSGWYVDDSATILHSDVPRPQDTALRLRLLPTPDRTGLQIPLGKSLDPPVTPLYLTATLSESALQQLLEPILQQLLEPIFQKKLSTAQIVASPSIKEYLESADFKGALQEWLWEDAAGHLPLELRARCKNFSIFDRHTVPLVLRYLRGANQLQVYSRVFYK